MDRLRREAQDIDCQIRLCSLWNLYASSLSMRDSHNKAVMHNGVVDRTAKACGIGTTTVKGYTKSLLTGKLKRTRMMFLVMVCSCVLFIALGAFISVMAKDAVSPPPDGVCRNPGCRVLSIGGGIGGARGL